MSTEPIETAREVLDAVKVMDDAPGLLHLDGPTHEHEKAASSILDAAPALARAVVAVAELADRLDDEVSRYHEAGLYASMIRKALNGETQ